MHLPDPSQPRRRAVRAVAIGAVVATIAGFASLTLNAAPVAAATPSTRSTFIRQYGAFNLNGSIDQVMSSPALGDVTGDGAPEVVVGGMDGRLTIVDPDTGGALAHIDVDLGATIHASPTLVNVDGDGALEMLIAFVRAVPGASGVRIYDDLGHGAGLLFNQASSPASPNSGFMGTPAIGDINGDGNPDVVAAGFDQRVHAWNLNGSPLAGFPVYTYDTMISSPALADVSGDGILDIVVGGDMDFGQPLPAGGYLWVIAGNGQPFPGYPLRLGSEVIWSSPAVGDVNADGGLDVVVGTGSNFNANPDQRFLHALDPRTGSPLPGWPKVLDGNTMASPALADLDGDAGLEVVMMTGTGRVYAFDSNGTELWNHCARASWAGSCPGDSAIIASPVVANVDGDAGQEVLATMEGQLIVLDGATGAREANPAIYPQAATWAGANAPAVMTAGSTTLIASHILVDNGDLRRGAGDYQAVVTFSSAGGSTSQPWSHFKGSAARCGQYRPQLGIDLNRYVDAVYRDLLGRPVDGAGLAYWTSLLDGCGVNLGRFTRAISLSPEWVGHTVDVLYGEVFGRIADPGGRAYWINLIQNGYRVAAVAASLYGSDEWFFSHGGNNNSYVNALYSSILQREPDSGRAYWVDLLDRGFSRTTISYAFFQSYESNARRVDRLYAELMKRGTDPSGRDYWARQLVVVDDITLAALLTSSPEYAQRVAGR